MSTNHSRPPRVIIDELVYQKIMHWVNKSEYEVSGLGKVVMEDGDIRITEAYLLPQKNTRTTTDIEPQDVGKLAYESRDVEGELRFWWHSHVKMNVFWSGTDLATMHQLGQGGWFVHTVFNQRHETRTAITMNDPFPMLFDEIPLTIERVLDPDLINSWNKEYTEKVTNVVPKATPAVVQQFHQGTIRRPFSREEQEEIAKLASMVMADEDQNELMEITGNLNFPGLGFDGVYGDSDWPGGSTSEHNKGDGTVDGVLRRRDALEAKIERLNERKEAIEKAGGKVPRTLANAIETTEDELDEVEDELDVLEKNGMIHNVDRYSERHYRNVED